MLDAGDYVEAIIDTPDPDATPIPRPDVRRMLVPIGPVAVFGASNFPLAFSTAGGDTASALAAGCPVVVKGHPSHPGTGELVARELQAAVADAGLPDGTFAHLLAAGIEVGEALVDAPAIARRRLHGLHRRRPRDHRPRRAPPGADSGLRRDGLGQPDRRDRGRARDARAEAIVDGLVASVSNFGGQLCTKPGVVLVPGGRAPATTFARRGRRASSTRVEPTVLLNERLRDALEAAVDRLAALPEVEPLGRRGRVGRRGLPSPARRLPGAGGRGRRTARRCSRSTSARSSCCSATPAATSCSPRSAAIEGQLTIRCTPQPEEDARAARPAHRGAAPRAPAGSSTTASRRASPSPTACTTAARTPRPPRPAHTSVGMTAIRRLLRPVAWQNAPAAVLPPELRDANPLGIWRRVDGELTRDRWRARSVRCAAPA